MFVGSVALCSLQSWLDTYFDDLVARPVVVFLAVMPAVIWGSAATIAAVLVIAVASVWVFSRRGQIEPVFALGLALGTVLWLAPI